MLLWNPHAFVEFQPRSSVKAAYRFQAELEAKQADGVSL